MKDEQDDLYLPDLSLCTSPNQLVENQKIFPGDLFNSIYNGYLNPFSLYTYYFSRIPNLIPIGNRNCGMFCTQFKRQFQSQIYQVHYSKEFGKNDSYPKFAQLFYFLSNDLMIQVDFQTNTVEFYYSSTSLQVVNQLIGLAEKYPKNQNENPQMHVLVSTNHGLDTLLTDLEKTEINLEKYYNDDFIEIHQHILSRLARKNGRGLVLLHGQPGTGKTTYIRHLLSNIKKNVLFIPASMASQINNPELMSTLIQFPNSIVVIEDAETLLTSRSQNQDSPVSALLNLADGLLADALKIQIICTFNIDLSKIDHALTRKGRLIARYEFKELALEKCRILAEERQLNMEINQAMTLAALFHATQPEFATSAKRKTIGFN